MLLVSAIGKHLSSEWIMENEIATRSCIYYRWAGMTRRTTRPSGSQVREAMRNAIRVIPLQSYGVGSVMALFVRRSLTIRMRCHSLILGAFARMSTVAIADDLTLAG